MPRGAKGRGQRGGWRPGTARRAGNRAFGREAKPETAAADALGSEPGGELVALVGLDVSPLGDFPLVNGARKKPNRPEARQAHQVFPIDPFLALDAFFQDSELGESERRLEVCELEIEANRRMEVVAPGPLHGPALVLERVKPLAEGGVVGDNNPP